MIELPIITTKGTENQLINFRNVTRLAPTHDERTRIHIGVQGSEIILYVDLKFDFVKQRLSIKNLL